MVCASIFAFFVLIAVLAPLLARLEGQDTTTLHQDLIDQYGFPTIGPTSEHWFGVEPRLSYSLPLRRTLAIVGESGSGKSVSSMAVMGLHDPKTARITGSITVGGKEIVGLGEKALRGYRGADAAMIFQDPQSSLHPYFTIGNQIIESYQGPAVGGAGHRGGAWGPTEGPDPPGR